MNRRRLLRRISEGHTRNIRFDDFVDLVEGFGFREVRTRGSHRLFRRPGVRDVLNVQAEHGQAKAYQVRQLMSLVEEYDLRLEDE